MSGPALRFIIIARSTFASVIDANCRFARSRLALYKFAWLKVLCSKSPSRISACINFDFEKLQYLALTLHMSQFERFALSKLDLVMMASLNYADLKFESLKLQLASCV